VIKSRVRLEAEDVAAAAVHQIQEDDKNDNPPDPVCSAVIGITAAIAAGITAACMAAVIGEVCVCIAAPIVTFIVVAAAAAGRYLFVHIKNLPEFEFMQNSLQKAIG
jgi:hypothetical protein